MKNLLFLLCILVISSCNDASKPNSEASATSEKSPDSTQKGTETKYEYAYKLDSPYSNWQPGDQQHAVNVLNGLKAYEKGDIATCMNYFGDSIELHLDGYRATLSKDSLSKMFARERSSFTAYEIKMGDWESVISGDKKKEYVTLWYKEIVTDKKGKTDSLAIVDDLKIENGKIVELDQKIQHYPKPGKKM